MEQPGHQTKLSAKSLLASRFGRRGLLIGLALLLSSSFLVGYIAHTNAACATVPTTFGQVSNTVSVPSAATYRVWSRIMVPDTTNNSYYLQIDSTVCNVNVGDNAAIPANTWTWVDYQNGSTSSKINATLAAGLHTVNMIGKEADVQVDRVILTADPNCVPSGDGDNCANPPDTTPPTVAITSPANNASVTGTISVNTTASDDAAVSKVELYVDSVLKATDTGSPYNFSLDTATLTAGNHTLLAKAYDTSNNITSSTLVTINVQDVTDPTVSITSPSAGATLSGTAAFAATATDNVGVTKVEFYVDGTLKGTDTTSGYSISLDTTVLSNGSHSLTAKAFDATNNTTTSSAVSVAISNSTTPPPDTTTPNVSITSPSNGATVSGTAVVNATATDNVGVTKVEFYLDSVLKSTDTTAPYSHSFNTTTLSNTSHSLTAKAFDAANNTKTSSVISILVSNIAYINEDINQDGHVNLLDLSLLAGKYGQSGSGLGRPDINGDGGINLLDLSLLASKYGT